MEDPANQLIETLIKINGFYQCPECAYKTEWEKSDLKVHINAVHRKLKSWKCLDCTKGKQIKTDHLNYFIKQYLDRITLYP